jgi:two-component system NtrC family response regulator
MKTPNILVVDDEPNSLFGICQTLNEEGLKTIPVQNGKEALEKIKSDSIDLLITDERMPDLNGMQILTEVKRINPQIPVILITAYGSVSLAVEALKQGAFYFFEKPVFPNLERFITIIRQALKSQEMARELDHLRREIVEKFSFPNIIGNHPKMMEVFEIIGRVVKTDRSVLIQGESGTGKDLIVKTIHYNSLRRDKPLITVPCGALTDTLLTSELFGHTKGAFTGAVKETVGRFQAAHGGTLVLDEIGEVPLHLQKTLLRVIEEKEFERVGDNRSIKVDVRILSTTNRDLEEEAKKGNFRKDLYYRLNIVPITIPPLRERLSDIPLLAHHFLRKFQEGETVVNIDPSVLDRMGKYPWPGNIRELANLIQMMMVFCRGNRITIDDLPPHIGIQNYVTEEIPKGEINLMKLVGDLEKKWMLAKLEECDWNQEKTARLLGMTRKMLIGRMSKYHLKNPAQKDA